MKYDNSKRALLPEHADSDVSHLRRRDAVVSGLTCLVLTISWSLMSIPLWFIAATVGFLSVSFVNWHQERERCMFFIPASFLSSDELVPVTKEIIGNGNAAFMLLGKLLGAFQSLAALQGKEHETQRYLSERSVFFSHLMVYGEIVTQAKTIDVDANPFERDALEEAISVAMLSVEAFADDLKKPHLSIV